MKSFTPAYSIWRRSAHTPWRCIYTGSEDQCNIKEAMLAREDDLWRTFEHVMLPEGQHPEPKGK